LGSGSPFRRPRDCPNRRTLRIRRKDILGLIDARELVQMTRFKSLGLDPSSFGVLIFPTGDPSFFFRLVRDDL
jgi:hypothetical protein